MALPQDGCPLWGSVRGQCPGMVTGEGTRLGLGSKSVLGIKLGIRVKVRVGSASGLGVRVGVRVGVKNEVG